MYVFQLCSIKFFLGSLNDDADQQDSSDSEADENFSDPRLVFLNNYMVKLKEKIKLTFNFLFGLI